MGSVSSTRNVTKETVYSLEDAPRPGTGTVLQLRTGKVRQNALGGEIKSAIHKQRQSGQVWCSATGLDGDEHQAAMHGGTERAIHQYNPDHYASWAAEHSPHPDQFTPGAYGENLIATGMSEDNVCIGDVYRIGADVLVQVTEPRHPCHKLNHRFRWPRALARTIRTGRCGWNMRVLREGFIADGDAIALVRRPHPQWSVLNVQRVIRGRHVGLDLLAECARLPLTDLFANMARARLRGSPKLYTLVDADMASPRVRRLVFALQDDNLARAIADPALEPYAFAQITFGPPDARLARSYSIVEGDLVRFHLGVALDRNSRGGSAYLHDKLRIGDTIEMALGTNPGAIEADEKSEADPALETRVVIAGGIGITAFIPEVRAWEAQGRPYHVHYAVRTLADAAFLDRIPASKVTLYASSEGRRMDLASIIPTPRNQGRDGPGKHTARIFSCGPRRLMDECARITSERFYPEHMVHFEDFGTGDGGGEFGPAFEVAVEEPDTGRNEELLVPANKTLLDVLTDAGFDIVFSCKFGGCGACKVKVCEGEVDYKSTALLSKDRGQALQACVDRGFGKLKLEVD